GLLGVNGCDGAVGACAAGVAGGGVLGELAGCGGRGGAAFLACAAVFCWPAGSGGLGGACLFCDGLGLGGAERDLGDCGSDIEPLGEDVGEAGALCVPFGSVAIARAMVENTSGLSF
ncbi:MAG: hypothetical protein ACRC9T_09575, partial [Vibrionaceae bacterium]